VRAVKSIHSRMLEFTLECFSFSKMLARKDALLPCGESRLHWYSDCVIGFCQRTEFIRLLRAMKLSRESRYAIEGLMVLAQKPSRVPSQLQDIAEAAEVPASFLSKIFQKLKRANILTSSRGGVRGYALAHSPKLISMADVFKAIEGSDVFDRCIFWSDRCNDRSPCPIHFEWIRMRRTIVELLQKTTLADLARSKAAQGGERAGQRSRGGLSE
jgi:Rrf2 family protein